MRKASLSVAIVLAVITSAAVAWAAAASYTPPPETGHIFTVINFQRAGGRAQKTYVTVAWGASRRTKIYSPPYNACSTSTPAGVVIRLRHNSTDTTPLTISTTGVIVKGPYQGEPPLELLHPCYRLIKF
jgi:hypothetical protein